MKCGNNVCEKETENNKKYCSLACRNIYVNKNLRDYTKCSKTIEKKEEIKKIEYYKNPKKCISCDKKIEYEFRLKNKFCNKSCSATITNKNRIIKNRKPFSLEAINNISKANKERGILYNIISEENYYKNPKKCKFCNNDILYKKSLKSIYCNKICRNKFDTKDLTEFQKYKNLTKFKFNLADYKNEFDFTLIEKYGWYKPVNRGNNLKGVSRDHIISVRDGFNKKIDPLLLAHPANCKLMIHNENISKNKKSNFTLDELIEKIEIFDKKYGCFYNRDDSNYN